MAQRRMFHTDVVESDRFLDLSAGAQLLYFHLGMQADDDGFVNGPKQICRKLKRPPRDLKELIDAGFLLNFDGIMVIKHFRVANSLKNDRRKPLTYPEIAKQLTILKNRCYSTVSEASCQTLYDIYAEFSLEKNGIHLESQPNRTEENRTEQNQTEQNQTESNSAEVNRTEGPGSPSAQLRLMGGSLGKGVLLLNDGQINSLLERLGLDAFNYYTEKLSRLLLEGKVKSKNHYATIMKWYLEDTEV
jgi:hypothetical protein